MVGYELNLYETFHAIISMLFEAGMLFWRYMTFTLGAWLSVEDENIKAY